MYKILLGNTLFTLTTQLPVREKKVKVKVKVKLKVKVKVKFNLEHATKAQGGRRCIALFCL